MCFLSKTFIILPRWHSKGFSSLMNWFLFYVFFLNEWLYVLFVQRSWHRWHSKGRFLLMNWFTSYVSPLNVWLNVLFVQNVHGTDGIQKAFSSHELVHILCFPFKCVMKCAWLSKTFMALQMAFKKPFLLMNWLTFYVFFLNGWFDLLFCPTFMAQMTFKRASCSHELVYMLCLPFKCVIKFAFLSKTFMALHRWHSKYFFYSWTGSHFMSSF